MAMSLGESIIQRIIARRDRKRRQKAGPVGDFYRAGGNALLYEGLPVTSSSTVIDGGGYRGWWTRKMLVTYGCHCEVYEPIEGLSRELLSMFSQNELVSVHAAGLGGSSRTASFASLDISSSEYRASDDDTAVEAKIVDIAEVVGAHDEVACLKLNIEGAEYEALDRLIERDLQERVEVLLVQFHKVVPDYETRRREIEERLAKTHQLEWSYGYVWAKWKRHADPQR